MHQPPEVRLVGVLLHKDVRAQGGRTRVAEGVIDGIVRSVEWLQGWFRLRASVVKGDVAPPKRDNVSYAFDV